jgi:hypothetical protein
MTVAFLSMALTKTPPPFGDGWDDHKGVALRALSRSTSTLV